MQGDNYTTIDKYLKDCYESGYIGTMYDLAKQGMPIIAPIDQAAEIKAILTDSKVNGSLYEALGVDVSKLKKTISHEISRGIATGMGYADIARNISLVSNAPLSGTKTIARTEGHRIQEASSFDAAGAAKQRGADLVKQWDASLDGSTRDSHRQVDGEIKELEEKFSNGLMYPGDPNGGAAEVVNCRCTMLTRARAALDESELKTLKDRAAYFGLDKTENFKDFENKYLKAAKTVEKEAVKTPKILENSGKSGILKRGNTDVRKWYIDSVSRIPDSIDPSLPMYEKALKAFEARNRIRTQARNMMADEETRKKLEKERPNKTFEELIQSKMKRKGMTREEAIADIYETATKTNADVNKELGLEE